MRLDVRGEYPPDWPAIAVRVRTEAGHRCVRCHHPYMPKRDAEELGGLATALTDGAQWSPCDERCDHGGPIQVLTIPVGVVAGLTIYGSVTLAEWRILTVHHLDGDKSNCRWWNLLALCQRCHLYVQGKVIPERPWLFEHTTWFRPYVAGFYAWYYGQTEIDRAEAESNTDHWLNVGQPWRVA